MIRFSAALVVVAIGALIAGVSASSLVLVYLAIGISAAALLVLAAGVVVKRDEIFAEEPRPAAAVSGHQEQEAATANGLAPEADARGGVLTGARTPGQAQGMAAAPEAWPPAEGVPVPDMPSSFQRPSAPPTRADPVLPWADSLPTRVDISGSAPATGEAQPREKAPAASVRERVAPLEERVAPSEEPEQPSDEAASPAGDEPEQPSAAAAADAAPTSPMPVAAVLEEAVPEETVADGAAPEDPEDDETPSEDTAAPEGTVPEDTVPEDTVAFARMPIGEADEAPSPGDAVPADGSARTVPADGDTPATPAAVSPDTPDTQVTVVPGVPRYHGADCVLISVMDSGDVQKMTAAEAEKAGCTPCSACHPDD